MMSAIRIFCFSLFILASSASATFGQFVAPVKWTLEKKLIAGNEYKLVIKGKIDEGWSIYSSFSTDKAAVPLELVFETPDVELIGEIVELTSSPSNRQERADPAFNDEITIRYKKDITLIQKIRVKDATQPLDFYLTSMACSASVCTPPMIEDFKKPVKPVIRIRRISFEN